MNDTRHFRGNGGECLAPEVGIVTILSDVALEIVTKAILRLPYRNLASDPERAAEAGISELRQSGLVLSRFSLEFVLARSPGWRG